MSEGMHMLQVQNQLKWTSSELVIDPGKEHIYGIAFQAKGAMGTTIHPKSFCTFMEDGSIRQDEEIIDKVGILRAELHAEWQTICFEVFTKAGSNRLQFVLLMEGNGNVEIKALEIIEGGFPKKPPFYGLPYLKWIESLQASQALEKKCTEHSAGLNELPKDIKAYMEISPRKLFDLMPARRPLASKQQATYPYRWKLERPEEVTDENGEVIHYESMYPVTGYEDVLTPSGKVISYPYHEKDGPVLPDAYGTYSEDRVYLDKFLTSAKFDELYRVSEILAEYYRTTKDTEAGLRALAIFHAFTHVFPDWPVYGQYDWNLYKLRFFRPDDYQHWFAYIGARPWYIPGFGSLMDYLTCMYDTFREGTLWEEISRLTRLDARKTAADTILYTAKMTLKYDAYFRTDPWKFYHNTIGSEIRAFIKAGLSLGCPELVHYAINKAIGAYAYGFMADGMFPESVSYLNDMAAGMRRALKFAEGYSDPEGYIANIDGMRFDNFDPEKEIPLLNRIFKLIERLYYPDGSLMTFHDSWSSTVYPSSSWSNLSDEYPRAPRESVESYLLPEFGHAILGWGKGKFCIEGHLHYSLDAVHAHSDMLNFTLWAYGNEVAADIGYTHTGGYNESTFVHNLVMVDGSSQYRSEKGNLAAWFVEKSGCQVAQAQAPEKTYPNTRKYRRTIIGIPMGEGKDIFVDIFEVEGGNRHEWMTNGSVSYTQKAECSLRPHKYLEHLSEDGRPFVLMEGTLPENVKDIKLPYDKDGEKSHYFGALQNVGISENKIPWTVTVEKAFPEGEKGEGLGPRATTDSPMPGFRLHWLAPLDGEVILCEAPRNAYYHELGNKRNMLQKFDKMIMPKVIVRRDGEDLSSTFAAVWEPFLGQPFDGQVRKIENIDEKDGVGVLIQDHLDQTVILYRKPESQIILEAQDVKCDGHYGIVRKSGGKLFADLYNGNSIMVGNLSARIENQPALRLIEATSSPDGHYLLVEGALPRYPVETSRQPHRGMHIMVSQEGQSNRWLPLDKIEQYGKNQYKLFLEREPGFQYNENLNILKETFTPYRTLNGKAAVLLQSGLNIQVERKSGYLYEMQVKATGKVTVSIDGIAEGTKAYISEENSEKLQELQVDIIDNTIVMEISSEQYGCGWWRIVLCN